MTETAVIRRQYDEVIATSYDLDPQNLTCDSLDRALCHLQSTDLLDRPFDTAPLRVLDLGMGTGLFLSRLAKACDGELDPCGIDLSSSMIDIARNKLPRLDAYVDDAANFDNYFGDEQFDLICTHFITGFVSIDHLAPLIDKRLKPGGYWSFVGASQEGYPGLRTHSESRLVRTMFGTGDGFGDTICPKNEDVLRTTFRNDGFEIVMTQTDRPELWFPNFDSFMEYAYTGGWLTPFVEEMGLHNAGRLTKKVLNAFVFPIRDHHCILQGMARKAPDSESV